MTHVHHTLLEEFPEHKEKLHELKLNDAHFVSLHDKYDQVNEAINKAEAQIENLSDEHLEDLKKERLALKDEINAILSK
ncbi:YdcH family protein [Emcibacter sp.]|uniref:YdcH family protein n=1 Tax=Emcibacter sp. TaxID=1979954 RepID=UPI003A8FD13C